MIRVLVADDHELIRKGFSCVFSQTSDIELVGEAADGQGLLELARHQKFDVVILDVLMPGRGGLDIIQDLKQEHPNCKIVVVSAYTEKQCAVLSFKTGALAYLCKTRTSREIVAAVRAAAAGRRYVTRESAESLARFVGDEKGRSTHSGLTMRELQILLSIGAGLPPRKIAEELALSVKTVGTYRDRMMKKMGFESNAQAVRYVIEHRLLG